MSYNDLSGVDKFTCSKCRKDKGEGGFHKKSASPTGYDRICKKCKYEQYRVRYEAYGDRIRRVAEDWRQRNLERSYAAGRLWQESHRNVRRLQGRRRYWENPDEYRALAKIKNHKRRMTDGSYTLAEWIELMTACGSRCVKCGSSRSNISSTDRRGDDLDVDHIVPISRGGTNYIWNIQPLCHSCNLRKMNKTADYRPLIAKVLFPKPKSI